MEYQKMRNLLDNINYLNLGQNIGSTQMMAHVERITPIVKLNSTLM